MVAFARDRLLRRVAAAARLAGLYVLGVALLIMSLGVARDVHISGDFRELGMVFGLFFAFAFALLAVARRAGFAALWLVLLGLWTLNLHDVHSVLGIPDQFIGWSLLAFPLFVLGVLGTMGASRVLTRGWRVPPGWIVLIAWTLLAAGAFKWGWMSSDVYFEGAPYRAVATAARFAWGPAPFIIGLIETARVWVATRPTKIEAPAA